MRASGRSAGRGGGALPWVKVEKSYALTSLEPAVGAPGRHLIQSLDLTEPVDYVDPQGDGDYYKAGARGYSFFNVQNSVISSSERSFVSGMNLATSRILTNAPAEKHQNVPSSPSLSCMSGNI